MRTFLTLALACSLHVVAIGSQEPDRQSPDQIAITVQDAYPMDSIAEVFVITPSIDFTIHSTTDQEAVTYAAPSIDFLAGTLPIAIDLHRNLGEIVVERDKQHKPRDRYRYPIWDYEPIIEPPIRITARN